MPVAAVWLEKGLLSFLVLMLPEDIICLMDVCVLAAAAQGGVRNRVTGWAHEALKHYREESSTQGTSKVRMDGLQWASSWAPGRDRGEEMGTKVLGSLKVGAMGLLQA